MVKMVKIIEVVYEDGVFKPLEKVDLPSGYRVKMRIEVERGIMTKKFLDELKKRVETLPKSKVNLKKLDEIYHEGKVLH